MKFIEMILFVAFFGCASFGAELPTKLKGYAEAASDISEMVVTVDRIKSAPQEVLVLFDHHEAFYAFPSRKAQREEIELFFKKAARDHRKLHVRFNPWNAHILSVEVR